MSWLDWLVDRKFLKLIGKYKEKMVKELIDPSQEQLKFEREIEKQKIEEKEVEKVLEIKQKEKLFHEGNVYVFCSKKYKKNETFKCIGVWARFANGGIVQFDDKDYIGEANGFIVARRDCKCIKNNRALKK